MTTWSSPASAVIVTLGQQDFTDGTILVGVGAFDNASDGEPSPFDGFRGGDVAGPNFSATWTFNFANPGEITSAGIEIGIFDHDSIATGTQVGLFSVDAVDLTSELNAFFEARGGANGEYNVYTMSLPERAFGALSDGSAVFTLTLSAPGFGATGGTAGNGAGVDFATLSIVSIPEPGAVALVCFGSLLLVALRRRR